MIDGRAGAGHAGDERTYSRLMLLLFAQPTSLLVALFCGTAASGYAAYVSHDLVLGYLAAALAFVAVCRGGLALWFALAKAPANTAWRAILCQIGGSLFALLTGLLAARVLLVPGPGQLDILLLGFALAYALGISARNIARPLIALVQMLLVVMPMLLTMLLSGQPSLMLLAGLLGMLVPVQDSIMLQVFRNLNGQLQSLTHQVGVAEGHSRLALIDPVTGIVGRMGLEHHLAQLPAGARMAMFWIDLHRFKQINETLGHQAGDIVLKTVADRLTEATPPDSVIARYASDEFIALCPVANRYDAEQLADNLRAELVRPFRVQGHRIECGGAIGAALMPQDALDQEGLRTAADLALYHARLLGQNQICFFTRQMSRDLLRRKELEADLRSAILKDELSIFFQPIVDLESGRIRKFEALVRWFHPTRGEISPAQFIPVAEESGVIITLGNWIIGRAARVAAGWPDHVSLCINLSPAQIRAPGAALGIVTALRDARIDPRRIELEVTEKLFAQPDGNTAHFFDDMAAQGIRFALDDFGTGFSSLHYINQYPFRSIKVDRSFVSGPNIGVKSDAIIRAVAEMGSTLDMEIVAEGLETIAQVQAVRQAGCTLGQGYYFSRAVPDHIAAILLAREDDNPALARLTG